MTRPFFKKVFLILLAFACLQFGATTSWAEEAEQTVKKPIYYSFTEPFTINFLRQSNEKARYLQIKVALMSYEQAVIDNAELNLPMLQDALRTLFTLQTMDSVSTTKGRRMIQDQALTTLKTLLKEETGNGNIEGVYFTSFILQ